MNNQFQDFSNRMIGKHKGFGQMFDSAPMVFPELEPAGETGGTTIENHYIKNLYQIRNLTEENHLYRQNLQFVTNILEKKLEQRVVPSVEKLVEKTIQEELPDVEKQVIHEMTDRLQMLVKEGGVEQLTVLREQLIRETKTQQEYRLRETERQKETLREHFLQEAGTHTSEVQRETEVRAAETRRELEREVRSQEMKRELIKEVRATESSREPQITVNNREREIRTESNSIEKDHTTEKEHRIEKEHTTEKEIRERTEVQRQEQLTELQKLTTITNLMKQEILLRNIENIYNSSTQNHFYGNAGQMGIRSGVQMPRRTFDSLHLEYGAQVPAEVTGNIQGPEVPGEPEFLKQQERILEQQRENIARQLKSLTQQTASSIQNKSQSQNTTVLQHRAPSQNTIPLQNADSSQDEDLSPNTVWLQNTEPSQDVVTQLPHMTPSKESVALSRTQALEPEAVEPRVLEPGVLEKTLTVPEHRSRFIFRVEDLKQRRQPAQAFQEVELLYSFEQTSDEHWNEIRQEIVKELQNEKSRETGKPSEKQNRLTEGTVSGTVRVAADTSKTEKMPQAQVSGARQMAERIFRQAGETIRQQTGGNVTIHPAALEYLEQALESQSGQISGTAQEQRRQGQQTVQPAMEYLQLKETQSSDGNAVLHTVERILDAYRVQREPVKAAARSVKPKAGIVQKILDEPGNVRRQSQMVSQSGAVRIQQVPGVPGAMMIQVPADVPSDQPGTVRPQMQSVSQSGAVMVSQPQGRMPQTVSLVQMSGTPAKGAMEQAPMIYPEEVSPEEQAEQSRKIEKQIHEITQDIKEIKKSTVVHQEILTEQQKEVVREVIQQAPETVKEKDVSTLIRRQVQREVETQVDASLGQMTNRVYRRIEEKLRTERGRRGLL